MERVSVPCTNDTVPPTEGDGAAHLGRASTASTSQREEAPELVAGYRLPLLSSLVTSQIGGGKRRRTRRPAYRGAFVKEAAVGTPAVPPMHTVGEV
jgi:hypothetical protein